MRYQDRLAAALARQAERYVYVIADGLGGPCKLGRSDSPVARLTQLQDGNPRELTLYWSIAVDEPELVEAATHRQLLKHRVRGEWFAVTVEEAIKAFREAIATGPSSPPLPEMFAEELRQKLGVEPPHRPSPSVSGWRASVSYRRRAAVFLAKRGCEAEEIARFLRTSPAIVRVILARGG